MNIVTLSLCMFGTFLLQIVVAGDEVEVHSDGSMYSDAIAFCSLPACSCFVIIIVLLSHNLKLLQQIHWCQYFCSGD